MRNLYKFLLLFLLTGCFFHSKKIENKTPERITFIFDFEYVNCANPDAHTVYSKKKSDLIKFLKKEKIINGKIIHIGDGENDLEVWKSGKVDLFIGFGVNKVISKVAKESPIFVKTIEEFDNLLEKILTLEKVKNLLEQNHPGFYDSLNPEFSKIAEQCYKNSIKEKYNLQSYIKCFNDNHLYLRNPHKNNEDTDWIKSLEWKYNISEKTVYLKIPTFTTSKITESKIENYRKILDKNPQKDIIFDIRGNGGGNNMYFQILLKKLFGKKYYNSIMNEYYAKTYIEVRSSQGNVEYWNDFYRKNKIKSGYCLKKINQCLKNGIDMCKISTKIEKSAEKTKSKFKNKIFVIIDGNNFSASLDFIDELKLLAPNQTILVGKKTGQDSLYMNVREVEICNGKILGIPTQVWRNRLRGDGGYTPDIEKEMKENLTTEEIEELTKYKLVVYPGRFQPFHQGHYDMIKEARKHGKHILIAISQAKNMQKDDRNVFTGNDREKMIEKTLQKDGFENYSIIQLDYVKSKALQDWDRSLINAAKSEYKKIFKKEPSKKDIAFIYYDRDRANYDKRFGDDFEIIEVKSSFDDDISATKIREEFFKECKINEKLPIGTKEFFQRNYSKHCNK